MIAGTGKNGFDDGAAEQASFTNTGGGSRSNIWVGADGSINITNRNKIRSLLNGMGCCLPNNVLIPYCRICDHTLKDI